MPVSITEYNIFYGSKFELIPQTVDSADQVRLMHGQHTDDHNHVIIHLGELSICHAAVVSSMPTLPVKRRLDSLTVRDGNGTKWTAFCLAFDAVRFSACRQLNLGSSRQIC